MNSGDGCIFCGCAQCLEVLAGRLVHDKRPRGLAIGVPEGCVVGLTWAPFVDHGIYFANRSFEGMFFFGMLITATTLW